MSTQTATQTVAQPSQSAESTQGSTVTPTAPAKRQKITDRIVSNLRTLEDGQTLTISELYMRMSDVGEKTLQATLSQLVKAGRVEKVKTGKRQPGYKAPTPK